ncbi:MAG: methyltransferase domain-containing protein [Deltaproteobacteria bacterium]|nr:methyltransferase domain-containing protein [Deltaproteobacteria bacterium]MBW2070972.1 methyltransferase domain-containing protein [Deltaproteobacteria bacterium]
MGFIFDSRSARHYDDWYQKKAGREVLQLELDLIERLLEPRQGERLVDIGCGTGMHLAWFQKMMLQVSGLDASPYMLDRAKQRLPATVDLHRGRAEDLPFDDNEFDLATMINTLEFVDNPTRALAEAIRVTRRRLVLGVLNKYALLAVQRRLKGLLVDTIYRHARFFSIWELKEMLRSIAGPVPIQWGTVLFFPLPLVRLVKAVERQSIFQHNPWGAFIVMSVDICYQFITCSDPVGAPLQQAGGQLPQGTLKVTLESLEGNKRQPPGRIASA